MRRFKKRGEPPVILTGGSPRFVEVRVSMPAARRTAA
jgi:hypothetical protein